MSPNDQPTEAVNPYACPKIPSLASGVAVAVDSDSQQLQAFVGSNARYYLGKWMPILQSRHTSAGFNWAAFLLSGLWLPYRKMYRVTLIFYAIIILVSTLEEVVFVGMLGEAETPTAFDRAVGLIAAVVCGSYGNRWYLSHARRVLSEVSATGLQGDALVHMVGKRGGTSAAASLGMLLLFIAVEVAVSIPLSMLLYED